MSRLIAALAAAWCLCGGGLFPAGASAQDWNDERTLALVRQATARRAQQLADSGLVDYAATAHGYLTFLAQLGEGFTEPPKVVKADELALEVYWRAPNLSKQRIVGRRDTLLLPTDINYHRDHLGIVQNNFPNIIRLGEGDEVRDVPHPLSASGLQQYDFLLQDSLTIKIGERAIRVHRLEVRPKDAKQARMIGAVYLELETAQVVRMTFSFTRAAFLDRQLEDISIILESALYETRFWLPRQQEIEIVRSGSFVDTPARGIIRGRWEICCYRINAGLAPALFTGPEIVEEPRSVTRAYPFEGRILDALPQDVRAVTDAEVRQVQQEVRRLVQESVLQRAQGVRFSFPRVSDLIRFNRVEGLAAGSGVRVRLGGGVQVAARGRWGFDDEEAKGEVRLGLQRANGVFFSVFGAREYREADDIRETSLLRNSLAAQEFGSDYTDPYDVRTVGVSAQMSRPQGGLWRLEVSRELQRGLSVHAAPASGRFEPTIDAWPVRATRVSLAAERTSTNSARGFSLSHRVELRGVLGERRDDPATDVESARLFAIATLERPLGGSRLVLQTSAGGVVGGSVPPQELLRVGGPVSGPGYGYHSLVGRGAFTQRVELRMRAPFPAIGLGRFGTAPRSMTLAPYAHVVYLARPDTLSGAKGGWYPSLGVGGMFLFDILRADVARGLRDGRWTFSIDVATDFWRIL